MRTEVSQKVNDQYQMNERTNMGLDYPMWEKTLKYI